ncbi:MAG: hypothetical protein ABEJ26_08280 [Halosimplex sp.]
MTEPNQAVVDELVREGESIGERGMVERIERHHEGPGVAVETVQAYAHELEAREDYAFDHRAFLADVAEDAIDAERWDGAKYYELDADGGSERISLFPRAWHDRLGGSTDVADYVEFVRADEPGYLDDLERGGPGAGVPRQAVIRALVLVGRVDRPTAETAVSEAVDRGDVVADTDLSPKADLYLPGNAPE